MDPYVASPHWHEFIILYFYLGGIAGGSYAIASLVELVGNEEDQRAARVAYYIAFPLVSVCGVLLIIDLNRPERFWHMLIQSQTLRPMFKWWSPMSAGSWGLTVFSAFSFVSFVAALAEDHRFGLGRWSPLAARLRRGWLGMFFALGGAAAGFFLASYTGTLLTATNQPVWAQTTWLAPLFLASAVSTGVAAVILLVRWRVPGTPHAVVERLGRVDACAMVLEAVMLVAFALSIGDLARPALARWPGVLVPTFVVPLAVVFPLIARRGRSAWWELASAVSVLIAGFALRYAIVGMPELFLLAS